MEIPKQLLKLKFCRVRKKTKKPFEENWTKKPYTYQEIQEYIKKGENYGILCGYDGLCVIDCDAESLAIAIENLFPETFTIQTGNGGKHFYFFISPNLEKKIILEFDDGKKDKNNSHLGEIQTWGTQVVGAGSIHPNGNEYIVFRDSPIANISLSEIYKNLKSFIPQIKETEKTADEENKLLDIQGDGQQRGFDNEPNVADIFGLAGLKQKGNEYFGSHPIHDSKTGMNFHVNPMKNIWHCFRHNTGGSWMSAVAIKHGLIDCSEAYRGRIRGDLAKECIKIGKENYGLIIKPFTRKYNPVITLADRRILTKFSPKPFSDDLMKDYKFRYDNYHRFWVYDNSEGIWKEDAEDFIKNILRKNSFGDEQQKEHYTTEIVKYLQQWNWTREMPDDMDKNILAFKNCLANIETGELFPFSPDYFITTKLDVEINPEFTECPKLDKFFEELVGVENKSILYDIIAYCFTRHYFYQKMFILWGRGQNGKTTFLDLLIRILGKQNISSETPQDLATNEFSKGELFGKFANISSELPYSSIQDTNVIKALCGGDFLKCNRKYKQPFQFRNFAKLLFSGNELPAVADKTLAWARRLYIIKFDKVIKNPVKNYLDTICTQEELKGLAWKCFHRLRQMKEKGWEFEKEVNPTKMMTLYEDLSDPLKKFLREECIEDGDGFIFKFRLRDEFESWCKQNGFRVWSEKELSNALKQLYEEQKKSIWIEKGFENIQKRWNAWIGIKFRRKPNVIEPI